MCTFRFTFVLIIVLLLFSPSLISQENPDEELSGISLNPVVGDMGEHFNTRDQNNLQVRMEQIVTNYGVGGTSFNPNFVVVPDVFILDHQMMGGAPPRVIVSLEVILRTGNAETETIFSSVSVNTEGVGANKDEAISKALSSLNTRSNQLESFINDTKNEIIAYYENHCDDIITSAKSHAAQEEFERAFSELHSIPSMANCYGESREALISIFEDFQEVQCEKMLAKGKAAQGAGNMDQAAQYLALIPADSECREQAAEISKEMSEERILKFREDARVEKAKAEAALEIAKAFVANQPDRVDVNFFNE